MVVMVLLSNGQRRFEAMVGRQEGKYRWWPRHCADSANAVDVQLGPWRGRALAVSVLIAFAFFVPGAAQATGVRASEAFALLVSFAAWGTLAAVVLQPRAARSAVAFHAMVAGNLAVGLVVMTAFPVLGGNPQSPLWVFLAAYAGLKASAEDVEPSLGFLFAFAAAPLLTIPLFISRGADPRSTVASAVLSSAVTAMGYHVIATKTLAQRKLRAERAAETERWRTRALDLERTHLARDLHDSIGSSLALVALYCDLLERHADHPAELRGVVERLRRTTRFGISELRGVLMSLAPEGGTVASVAEALRLIGSYVSEASVTDVTVDTAIEVEHVLTAPERLALVRVFQEAVHNAVEHGRAQHIAVTLSSSAGGTSLRVHDDGAGFDTENAIAKRRGLFGVQERVRELGGNARFASSLREGSVVEVSIPALSRPDEPNPK